MQLRIGREARILATDRQSIEEVFEYIQKLNDIQKPKKICLEVIFEEGK